MMAVLLLEVPAPVLQAIHGLVLLPVLLVLVLLLLLLPVLLVLVLVLVLEVLLTLVLVLVQLVQLKLLVLSRSVLQSLQSAWGISLRWQTAWTATFLSRST